MKLNLNYPRGDIEYLVLQLDLQINVCHLFPKQSRTNLVFLAYLYTYGYIEAKKKLLEDEILLSGASFVNAIWKMRKQGLVVGKHYERFKDEKAELSPLLKIGDHLTITISSNELIKSRVIYSKT